MDQKHQYTLDNLSIWIDTRAADDPTVQASTPQQDAQARVLINHRLSLNAILSNPKLAKKNYVIPVSN